MKLCALWGEVRYLHPWVVEGRVDWDTALVAALPAALAAQTDDDAAAAARSMLDALHDPATRVDRASTLLDEIPGAERTSPPPVDGVPVVVVSVKEYAQIHAVVEQVRTAIKPGKPLVLDLRGGSRDSSWLTRSAVEDAAGALVAHAAVAPTARYVEHHGYRPQSGTTSGGYGTMLVSELATSYRPSGKEHPSRVVFLTDARGGVPDVAWAMQAAGDASIVVAGKLTSDENAATNLVHLAGGWVAHVRRAEVGGGEPRADLELDPSLAEAKIVEAAVRAAKRPGAPHRRTAGFAATAAQPVWQKDATYDDAPYPSKERRMLGLFRFWSVIHYFYPYLPLMGRAWDEALADFVPRFEAAADAREYVFAVAELAARIPDGHVSVWGSKELVALHGKGQLPFDVRIIEGQPAIAVPHDEAAFTRLGVELGDVVVSMDGEPVEARMARLTRYFAASNESYRGYRLANMALRCDPAGPPPVLGLRGRGGAVREVQVPCTTWSASPQRSGPVYRLLDDATGYADLDRLETGDVDAMFKVFASTQAIVFDMRGYPHGTAWVIAPRLNVREATAGAQFFEPLVSPLSAEMSFFRQPLPPTDRPLYRGKTVMLIDERTMSQSEHTGLFFEAANGTRFVGSQTAGANGDVTNLSLPGGLYVSFSGHDVRHADGRQLQRVGLVPDVEVHPTLEALRTGRDEVLDRARELLRTGK
ncbi:MAG TPA: S41 family peptidase [Polyangiaceae bacterium]